MNMRGYFGGDSPPARSSTTTAPNSDFTARQQFASPSSEEVRANRRSFAFMKSSPGRRSEGSMIRTREHARQIAMQIATPNKPQQQQQQQSPYEWQSSAAPEQPEFQPFPATAPSDSSSFEYHRPRSINRKSSSSNSVGAYSASSLHTVAIQKRALKPPAEKKKNALNSFMEQQQHQQSSTPSFRNNGGRSVISETSSAVSGAAKRRLQRAKSRVAETDKTVHSMPTFPSNSSMQADFAQSKKQPIMASSSSQSVMSNISASAAARRRMRKQLRGGSAHEQEEPPPKESLYAPLHATNESSSGFSSSPVPMRTPSIDSSNSSWSSHHREGGQQQQQQQQQPRAVPATPPRARSSFVPEAPKTPKGGFTFDAFGLDEMEVDSEVNAALQDLAGDIPDLRDFLGKAAGSAFPRTNSDLDTVSYRSSSSRSLVDSEGFEMKNSSLPAHVRRSPIDSERSSLTSSTGTDKNHGRVNMFKEQAHFHTSSKKATTTTTKTAKWDDAFNDSDSGAWEPFEPKNPSPQYAKSEPGGAFDHRWAARGLTITPPPMPDLMHEEPTAQSDKETDASGAEFDQSSWAGDSDGELSPSAKQIPVSEAGAPPSRVGPSDTGATTTTFRADFGVSSNGLGDKSMGEMPGKHQGAHSSILPKKNNTHKTQQLKVIVPNDDDNDDTEDDGFGEPLISPSNASVDQWQRQGNGQGVVLTEKKDRWGETLRASPVPPQQRKAQTTPTEPKNKAAPPNVFHRTSPKLTEQQQLLERMRNTPRSSSKSEVGQPNNSFVQHQEVQDIAKRVAQDWQTDSFRDAKSDIGASSANFFPEVKLKESSTISTFASTQQGSVGEESELEEFEGFQEDEQPLPPKQLTYRERRELELKQQKPASQQDMDQQKPEPQAPKLTYRERRELQMKQQSSKQEKKEVEEEKSSKEKERDVAELIRRRIAVNRKKAATSQASTTSKPKEDVAVIRNKLKKVSLHEKPVNEDTDSPAAPFSPNMLKKTDDVQSAHSKLDLPQTSQESALTLKAEPKFEPNNECETDVVKVETHESDLAIVDNNDKGASVQYKPNEPVVARYIEEISKCTTPAILPQKTEAVKEQAKPTSCEEEKTETRDDGKEQKKSMLSALFAKRLGPPSVPKGKPKEAATVASPIPSQKRAEPVSETESDSKPQLSLHQMLSKRSAPPPAQPKSIPAEEAVSQPESTPYTGGGVAMKDDPKFSKYFRMLKFGMPMDVVKHAMVRDGLDGDILDGDHNKPVGGVPLKEDPKFEKYFKMMKVGLSMGAIKNAMERDGMDSSVLDGDHNAPVAGAVKPKAESKPKDTHRRTRLHWETLRKVRANSLWAKINEDEELDQLHIDEEEFTALFQAELTPSKFGKDIRKGKEASSPGRKKRGPSVQVIDPKRANNGGIVLARLKISQDDMADAVDKIDETVMTAEQVKHIVEYLPTQEEKRRLEAHMLEGGMDAATKFDMLCECEKFMVAMMTVKHAKRKIRALLFKLEFESCLASLKADANIVEDSCDQLFNSVRLRKLLGIVLNLGNRLNTAGNGNKSKAGAFAVESLLKLSHAKAFDKKTTFLQYVVLIVHRNNEKLLKFKDDLPAVLKADKVFWDQCLNDLEEVENQLENVRRMALHQARMAQRYRLRRKKKTKETDGEDSLSEAEMTLEEEVEALRATKLGQFTLIAIKRVSTLREKVELTNRKFARLKEYFGIDEKRGEMQPHELFNIFVVFSKDFAKAQEQVTEERKKQVRAEKKRENSGKGTPSTPTRSNKLNGKKQSLKASNFQPHMGQIMQPPPSPSTKSEPGIRATQSNKFRRAPPKNDAPGKEIPPNPEPLKYDTATTNKQSGTLKLSEASVTSSTQASTAVPHSPQRVEANDQQKGRPPLNKPLSALSPRSSIRQRRRLARQAK